MTTASEVRAELEAIAREVAPHLGDEWSVRPRTAQEDVFRDTVIVHTDGRSLRISNEQGKPDRLVVTGQYPYSTTGYHGVLHVSITVAKNRGAATIAKEIVRRVLPDYTTRHQQVVDYQAKQASDEALRRQRMTELQRICKGHLLSSHDRLYGGGADVYAQGAADTVRIEMRSVPFATARKILALVAERNGDA